MDLNAMVVKAAIQDHLNADRTPVEAAGEVRFLDEVMVKHGISKKEDAEATRRLVESWLAETLDVSGEDLRANLQLAEEYTQFLHERVVTQANQMPRTENAWREWRQTRGEDRVGGG